MVNATHVINLFVMFYFSDCFYWPVLLKSRYGDVFYLSYGVVWLWILLTTRTVEKRYMPHPAKRAPAFVVLPGLLMPGEIGW